jgi:hypothetical protein
MTIGGDYDTPQKQAVRERLWDVAVRDLIDGHGLKASELRLLDLPGARCTYLRHLQLDFGVARDNMVAVERYEEPFLAIHRFLGGRGVVRHGLIEDLCDGDELEKYFPIDLANLDFCGQGFIFPDLGRRTAENLEYQRRWDCVKRMLDFNKKHGKDSWYLLLTLACNRNNPAGRAYLKTQLAELCEITGNTKDADGWKDNRLIQEVVPKIIAEEALQYDYVPSAAAFDSYRYVQEDHAYQMVAWKFRLDLDGSKTLGRNVSRRKRFLDEFCGTYFASDAKELDL